MFNPELLQIFKTSDDGRYDENDMENVDAMLNYENNEFMSSDFFDTIRSVESGIQDDFLNCTDDFNTSSDTSSHIDGYISPRNDVSETEGSSIFTDESTSPIRAVDTIDDSLFDFLQPMQNNFELESAPVIINPPKPRKIIIQNSASKKIVNTKSVINNAQIKKIGKKQILKVQSLTANGKPVILPYGLKSIKILNASDLKTDRIHVTTLPTSSVCRPKVETTKRDNAEANVPVNKLSEVKLTPEEKRLLDKEGIQLPTYHPLTKMEDRELKRIRRKIRNKISAQDSRKRKKEYVDGLEERVRRGSEDNRNLMQRVKELQKKNKTLLAHINKLQSLIFNSSSSKATPSTCLMIVMLSVFLVSLPNIRLSQMNKELSTDQEQVTISRSLLSTKKLEDDGLNMEEFFVFNKDEDLDNENNTENEFFKAIEEMENKYDNMHFDKDNTDGNFFNTFMQNIKNLFNNELSSYFNSDYGGLTNKKGFIEPDIDDFDTPAPSYINSEPPAKKMKLIDEYYHQNDENFVPLNNKVIAATVHTNTLTDSKDK